MSVPDGFGDVAGRVAGSVVPLEVPRRFGTSDCLTFFHEDSAITPVGFEGILLGPVPTAGVRGQGTDRGHGPPHLFDSSLVRRCEIGIFGSEGVLRGHGPSHFLHSSVSGVLAGGPLGQVGQGFLDRTLLGSRCYGRAVEPRLFSGSVGVSVVFAHVPNLLVIVDVLAMFFVSSSITSVGDELVVLAPVSGFGEADVVKVCALLMVVLALGGA